MFFRDSAFFFFSQVFNISCFYPYVSLSGRGERIASLALAWALASLGTQAARIAQSFLLLLSQNLILQPVEIEIQFSGGIIHPKKGSNNKFKIDGRQKSI